MHACTYEPTHLYACNAYTHVHTTHTPMHINHIHAQVHMPTYTYTYTGTHIYVHTLHVNYKLVKFPPPTQNKK